jgi:SAM-dependent methyltransferase
MNSLSDWLQTPPGQYLLAWEQAQLNVSVADIFGFHGLQLGLPEINALAANRMPHRWLALDAPSEVKPNLYCDLAALPFSEASLDLVVMPHTLELTADPHAALREAARVLVPEGRLVITCFNPNSLWGLRQSLSMGLSKWGLSEPFVPVTGEWLGTWRLRDWLHLLSFEVESTDLGGYRLPISRQGWLDNTAYLDAWGRRGWPIFGAVYCMVAVKKVHGMRLMGPAWKKSVRVPSSTRATGLPAARQESGHSNLNL